MQLGVGAVKFYDLKTDRRNGYDFDLEAMVSFGGETGTHQVCLLMSVYPAQGELPT